MIENIYETGNYKDFLKITQCFEQMGTLIFFKLNKLYIYLQ